MDLRNRLAALESRLRPRSPGPDLSRLSADDLLRLRELRLRLDAGGAVTPAEVDEAAGAIRPRQEAR